MSKIEAIFPVEFSADGKRNAFSHTCAVVGHTKGYAVCLSLIARRNEKNLDALYADCLQAIDKKRCPALLMRAEEASAGKAIYFRERIKNLGETLLKAASEMIGLPVTKGFTKVATSSKKTAVVNKSQMIDVGSYAEAINLKSSEVAEKPVIAKLAPAVTKAVVGETLIEMAKRMMREKNELK